MHWGNSFGVIVSSGFDNLRKLNTLYPAFGTGSGSQIKKSPLFSGLFLFRTKASTTNAEFAVLFLMKSNVQSNLHKYQDNQAGQWLPILDQEEAAEY